MAKKLAESTSKVLAYLQENDMGEGVAISEIASALGKEEKQIRPMITLSLRAPKDGSRGALATYDKKAIEGVEKPVGYAFITDEGKAYVETEDEAA